MNNKPKDANAISRTFRSSISVSNKKVCDDEACIGKDVNPPTVPSAPLDEKKKKSPGTSMAVGGKQACSDDACIGKK